MKSSLRRGRARSKIRRASREVVTDSTKKNLQMRVEAENGATAGKTDHCKTCQSPES
mgnify:CR=1 FL=1